MRAVRTAFLAAVLLAGVLISMFPSVVSAEEGDAANLATSLLVISFLLSLCILLVSGFTLWQSHRYYLDTVRLSREITATVTEMQQKVLDIIYQIRTSSPRESPKPREPETRSRKPRLREPTPERVSKIAESISETEQKIRSLEKTLSALNQQFSSNLQPGDLSRKLAALSDVEYAVLLKLAQDPKFFEKNSFTSFGATPRVLDSLLSRQLIVFDKDGKAEVPGEVSSALRYATPEN
jgi:hypothetical protein